VGVEIERKFLVRGDGWRRAAHDSQAMRQGYLNNEKRCSVRVRVGGGRGWLNVKSATLGASRLEFEYAIPLEDAHHMLDELCLKPLIEKVRHFVEVGGRLWEVDEFEGDNAGLVVAEIELDDAEEIFEMPDWLGEEVTHDVRYYNTSLSRRPFKAWEAGT
jgi:adenylate cyclase